MTSVVQCTPNSIRENATAATATAANTHVSIRYARRWDGADHHKSQGGEHQNGDGGVTRRPRPTVRRDEPQIPRWAFTPDYVFGQRYAAVLPSPKR